MIKFFRHIRRSLLMERGKTGNYLKYAIGEIVLVVIGILIALSINNWNESSKLKIKEQKVLRELKINIEENIKTIDDKIREFEFVNNNITSIINFIGNEEELSLDSLHLYLERMRRVSQIEYVDAAFQSLKTLGFDLIESDSLRLKIIRLFDTTYDSNQQLINSAGLLRYSAINNYIVNHFSTINGVVVPNDINWMLNNQPFYNRLTMREDWRNYLIFTLKRVLNESKGLLESLNKEIVY